MAKASKMGWRPRGVSEKKERDYMKIMTWQHHLDYLLGYGVRMGEELGRREQVFADLFTIDNPEDRYRYCLELAVEIKEKDERKVKEKVEREKREAGEKSQREHEVEKKRLADVEKRRAEKEERNKEAKEEAAEDKEKRKKVREAKIEGRRETRKERKKENEGEKQTTD